MAMNRVQFQRGLSMAEFMDRYGTEDKCEAALVASRWPTRFTCPDCGGPARTSFRREGRLYWQCANCSHQCSLTSGTIFGASKLALTRWFLAMHLLTQAKNNVSALELKRHLGVCYRTAWLVKHKLMQVMQLREDSRQLTGRVEVDDAYLGGQRSGGKSGPRLGEQGCVHRGGADHRGRAAPSGVLCGAPVHQGVVRRVHGQVDGAAADSGV